ncbi:LysE family translocator [Leptolyngbya sp. CCY15150]|uniref:LysE family translocator n=1 Tax=Leptolyngbya sp. CCY15150 TaxID=2767772 RepID=UPI00194E9933|nr:LysE family translocator [Leptolyngbya sp. CCY15150]
MQSTITLGNVLALFGAMVVLASIPSVSVLAVSTRAATSGLIHGALTALGVVLGDVIFILIAILGLSLLIEAIGPFFVLIKYLGAAYLILIGVQLFRSKPVSLELGEAIPSSHLSSFLTGLLITLADQKAIFFYLGFFPAFLDLSKVSYVDAGIIIATAILSVGGVKLGYAILADRARLLVSVKVRRSLNWLAGSVMIAVGIVLVATARV